MDCPNCGSPLPEGAGTCGKCGTIIVELERRPPKEDGDYAAMVARVRRSKSFGMVALAGALIGLAALLVTLRPVVQDYGREAARREAVEKTRQEFSKAGTPVGMFGATWNMSEREVARANGPCRRLDAGAMSQERRAFGGTVVVNYMFSGGRLNTVLVNFPKRQLASRSEEEARKLLAEYRSVQDALSKDYGPMPEPAVRQEAALDTIESVKVIGKVALSHRLTLWDDQDRRYAEEQIYMSLNR